MEVAKIVAFTTLTFWLGILTVGGAVLAWDPLDLRTVPYLNLDTHRLGLLMLALPLGYVLVGSWRRQPLKLGPWRLPAIRPACRCRSWRSGRWIG